MGGEWSAIVQLGGAGVLVLFLWLIVKDGALRTKFEMTVREERTTRAEDLVDKMLPAILALTASVDKQSSAIDKQSEQITEIIGVAKSLMQELKTSLVYQRDQGKTP